MSHGVAAPRAEEVLPDHPEGRPVSPQARAVRPAKAVHLTSVHVADDNRIFHKECRSLAEAGFEVVLVAPHPADEVFQGIQIRAVPKPGNRLVRMFVTTTRVLRRGVAEKGDVYHIHDPEMVPWALVLRLMGKPVVYDVHEDYVTGIAAVDYLPKPIAWSAARIYSLFENIARRTFTIVIAERYYERRLKGAVHVLNHMRQDLADGLAAIPRTTEPQARPRFLYAGSITESRGALILAELTTRVPGIELVMVGRCYPELLEQMEARSGDTAINLVDEDGETTVHRANDAPNAASLTIEGVGFHVPHERIIHALSQQWTGALAVFPPSDFYREKELTKFFEYMAAGLPIISSNFPTWRALIETHEVGLVVDPRSLDEVASAALRLHSRPDEAWRFAQNGRTAMAEHFSWSSQADRLIDVYNRLITKTA